MAEEGETTPRCCKDPGRDPKVLADPPWIGPGQDDPMRLKAFCRRTDRMRSASTESVVTSAGDSSSSEPGSPGRPATPHHLMTSSMGGFECPSEDSGLGPSPAKSSPVSPILYIDDRCSDSLLDLSPRTEEDNNSEPEEEVVMEEEDNKSSSSQHKDQTNSSSGFQFLLAASQNSSSEDFSSRVFSEEEEEDMSSSSTNLNYASHHSLNPKVVLIRSDLTCYEHGDSSTCSQQSSSVLEDGRESGACKWLNCERPADANATAADLLEHIRERHVASQPENAESFVCLWSGCKVYARPSLSRSWLERHVLLHGGSKPFRCIVAGCRQRFGTEAALQRHVNSHFPHRNNHGNAHNQPRPGARNRKNRKHRRRPQSNKSKDFFDDATMEYVRHNLFRLSSIEGVVTSGPPAAITFRSIVKGKRKTEAGRVNYLLSWSPENIVPDVWVSEEEMVSEKTIPVSQLPCNLQHLLPAMDALGLSNRRKRKRK